MDALIVAKATLLLIAALGAARLLVRRAAILRHDLWTLTFAALLMLPALALVLPDLPVRLPAAAPAETTALAPAPDVTIAPPASPATSPPARRPPLATLLGLTWAAGSLVGILLLARSLWQVRRLEAASTPLAGDWRATAATLAARLGLRRVPCLLTGPHIHTPMAGGLWRPVVFLPAAAAAWTAEQRAIVLAHELTHVRHRDPLRHLLARVAVALYWFHPLVWIAARQARAVQEQACDDAVLALGTRPSAYAQVLVELADVPARPHAAALPMAERSLLETRIMNIVNGSPTTTRRRAGLLLAAVAVVTLPLAAVSSQTSAQRPQPGTAPPASQAGKREAVPTVPADALVKADRQIQAMADQIREQEIALRVTEQAFKQQEEAFRAQVADLTAQAEVLRAQIDELRSRAHVDINEMLAAMQLAQKAQAADQEQTTRKLLEILEEVNRKR